VHTPTVLYSLCAPGSDNNNVGVNPHQVGIRHPAFCLRISQFQSLGQQLISSVQKYNRYIQSQYANLLHTHNRQLGRSQGSHLTNILDAPNVFGVDYVCLLRWCCDLQCAGEMCKGGFRKVYQQYTPVIELLGSMLLYINTSLHQHTVKLSVQIIHS